MHPDLRPASLDEQAAVVQRALESGARHVDVGQGPDAEHVVLADPDGNELCVLPPGGTFLAGCPFFSSLAGDGLAEVGYFWRDALGWQLVWDQDGETAVQAPTGGPKITWGGDPVAPKVGRNRLHLDLTPSGTSTVGVEVERLVELGATRVDAGCADGLGMADPGGNEFCVVGLTVRRGAVAARPTGRSHLTRERSSRNVLSPVPPERRSTWTWTRTPVLPVRTEDRTARAHLATKR